MPILTIIIPVKHLKKHYSFKYNSRIVHFQVNIVETQGRPLENIRNRMTPTPLFWRKFS